MSRIFSVIAAIAVTSAILITPVAARGLGSHQTAKKLTVGVVLDVGGVNDKSFNHLAYLGLQQAIAKYHVSGTYVVSHSEADYVPNLTNSAQHNDLTIGVGFLMTTAMHQVASQFPNRKFGMVDGCPTLSTGGNCANLSNVANLFFKEQESGYLVGVMAGIMERNKVGNATHGKIGFMGGISIPPVNRYIAGYVAGARQVFPRIKIVGGYSQSFTDQGKGNQIGRQQISQGADILFQVAGASGLGYLSAAQQASRYGIGVDADQSYLGRFIVSSALKKVNVAVRLTIHSAQDGTFRGGNHLFSLKNNSTGVGKFSPVVPAFVRATVKSYARLIKQGKIVPPVNIPPY